MKIRNITHSLEGTEEGEVVLSGDGMSSCGDEVVL